MSVLVVAKTVARGRYCVGGLTDDGTSLRLTDRLGNYPPRTTPFEVGQRWDMDYAPSPQLVAPHVEDVRVRRRDRLDDEEDVAGSIQRLVEPWRGDLRATFGGLLGYTGTSRGYIQQPDVPDQSTGFWIPNADLERVVEGNKTIYEIETRGFMRVRITRRITYVGAAPSIPRIPAGTLVRLSLARWWRPGDADDDFPERCYLQLSGWYL